MARDPMTRLDDIRARVERSVEEKWNIDPDIPFLLSLVERAVELIDNEGFDPWSVDAATQWLRDVREDATE